MVHSKNYQIPLSLCSSQEMKSHFVIIKALCLCMKYDIDFDLSLSCFWPGETVWWCAVVHVCLKSSVTLCSCERMHDHIACSSEWVQVMLGVRGCSVAGAEGILRVTWPPSHLSPQLLHEHRCVLHWSTGAHAPTPTAHAGGLQHTPV